MADSPLDNTPTSAAPQQDAPLSLKRLTAAFAQMLGSPRPEEKVEAPTPVADPCEIGPRSIVEAVLFVGAPGDEPRTAKELAAAMRDVSPDEVDEAVAELNGLYDRDAAPYHIASSAGGYRLELREDMRRMRDKFHGRVKETRLSAGAMETLSIIAYKQPVTLARIDQMRGGKNGALVSLLVRRGLVRLDEEDGERAYRTTERFLRVFGLGGPKELPRVAELDD